MLRADVAERLAEIHEVAGKAAQIVPNTISSRTTYHDYEREAVSALLAHLMILAGEVMSA